MKRTKAKRTETSLAKDRIFRTYYREVGRTKMLDAQTERNLFLKYQRTGSIKARDALVHNCLRQVVKLARQYSGNSGKIKDLISAGNMGVLCALDRYDPNRNTRFLSYATYYIKLYIRKELYGSDLVSMPRWRQKAMSKIKSVKAAAEREGREADDEEICMATDLSKAQLERLQVCRLHFPSIDDVTPLHKSAKADREVIAAETKSFLGAALKTLNVRERFILRAYYGFIDEPWSLRQIANFLGVTSERIRQIKRDALCTLQKKFSKQLRITRTGDLSNTA